jgi:hypothetical protein
MRAREGVALAGDVAQQTIPRLLAPGKEITTYHGTPHTFAPTQSSPLGEFDLGKMGTGEGAQTYGRGMYLTEDPEIGDWYRRQYSENLYDYPEGAMAWREKNFPGSDPPGGDYRRIYKFEVEEASRIAAERAMEPFIRADSPKGLREVQLSENRKTAEDAASWVAGEIRKGTRPEDILKYVGNHPNVNYVRMLEAAIEPWKGLTEVGGSLYEVGLQAHPEELLDLNKPLSEQSSQVQTTLNEMFPDLKSPDSPLRGRPIYGSGLEVEYPVREDLFSNPESTLYTAATDLLSSRGVPGAQYTGRSSGARDYTIWDPRRLSIIKKLMAAIGAVGAGDEVRRRSSSNGT